jgi:hypothetical protein
LLLQLLGLVAGQPPWLEVLLECLQLQTQLPLLL